MQIIWVPKLHSKGIKQVYMYIKFMINYIFSVVPLLFRSMYSSIQETWIGQTSRKWELLNWSSVHETWWNFIISLGTLSYYNRRNILWNQTTGISISPDTILEFLCEHLITRLYRIQAITGLRSKIKRRYRGIFKLHVLCLAGTWSDLKLDQLHICPWEMFLHFLKTLLKTGWKIQYQWRN